MYRIQHNRKNKDEVAFRRFRRRYFEKQKQNKKQIWDEVVDAVLECLKTVASIMLIASIGMLATYQGVVKQEKISNLVIIIGILNIIFAAGLGYVSLKKLRVNLKAIFLKQKQTRYSVIVYLSVWIVTFTLVASCIQAFLGLLNLVYPHE